MLLNDQSILAGERVVGNLLIVRAYNFFGGESFLYWLGVGLIQYWRTFEDLEHEPHLKAWQRFNRVVGADGSVGIWHETYLINPVNYEAIYGNMPIFGLAAATKHISVTERKESARRRVENRA
ncbi:MAG: DUF4188 domain-containing protein [Rivularia sp. T60_A2020_040]|nr:DUF4188 domain-containing protein [Rivularia sp. T60_A2020_040]